MDFICIYMYLGDGRGVLLHLYVWEHIVSLNYWTAWLVSMTLGIDEVVIALRMCLVFLARSAEGWIQSGTENGMKVPLH